MTEAGYTATEALAALAILGLALGGLTAGLKVIGHGQMSVGRALGDAAALRGAEAELTRILGEGAPFRSDEIDPLAGGSRRLEFRCGATRCAAELEGRRLLVRTGGGATRAVRLPAGADYAFTYVAADEAFPAWPAAATPEKPWRALTAVAVEDVATHRPVVLAPVWPDQAANCEFDTISRDCRKAAP